MLARIEDPSSDLVVQTKGQRFSTIMADPPWRFQNSTGKVAPEHKRLNRYGTMTLDEIKALRVSKVSADTAHLYLWVPNALLPVVTLGGLAYAELLVGTVLTETIFSWPGLGRYTYQSALALDFPAIMGMTFLVAVIYLVMNFVVDLSYLVLDPRVVRR